MASEALKLQMQEPQNQQAAIEEVVDKETARVVRKVVDEGIAKMINKESVAIVREGVSEVVRNTLTEVASREMREKKMALPAAALTDGAVAKGLEVLKSLEEIRFPEFTSKLITDTYDAIIAATIHQMEAYANLVADLGKTLKEFQAENVGDAQVDAHLAERYPDGSGGTVVRKDYTFQDSGNEQMPKTANQKLQEAVAALKREAPKLAEAKGPFEISDPGPTDNSFGYLVTDGEDKIRTRIKPALAEVIAASMRAQLERMAQLGMARIVVTDGEIFSKLTFNVAASEEMEKQKSRYASQSFSANVKGKASWGWGKIKVSASYSQLNVRAVNERNFNRVSMDAQIIGQVKVNFRTETFPPVLQGARAA